MFRSCSAVGRDRHSCVLELSVRLSGFVGSLRACTFLYGDPDGERRDGGTRRTEGTENGVGGAAECVFVDESAKAVKLVRENLSRCKLQGRVMQADALACLSRGEKYDIIFLDPPYDTTLLDKCLEIVQNVDILTDGGIIVCESRREKTLPELKAPLSRVLDRVYGKIKITVYKKET